MTGIEGNTMITSQLKEKVWVLGKALHWNRALDPSLCMIALPQHTIYFFSGVCVGPSLLFLDLNNDSVSGQWWPLPLCQCPYPHLARPSRSCGWKMPFGSRVTASCYWRSTNNSSCCGLALRLFCLQLSAAYKLCWASYLLEMIYQLILLLN